MLLYGPPGVGKLTVANILAARHGFRVLDNHLSLDPALRLFDFGTPELATLVERIRVELLTAAAQARLDVITTLVFAHPIDLHHVNQLTQASQAFGGHVTYVQLLACRQQLERRVLDPSRAATQKIRDPATLGRTIEHYDLNTPIQPSDLSIDTSDLAPDDVAHRIARELGLLATRTI
jgi:dephospho-CoA kinase